MKPCCQALGSQCFQITPWPLIAGVVVRCRTIGILKMEDEAGGDEKLIAVPIDKVLPLYKHWKKPADMQPERLAQIQHFFEHYKDLEKGKWVKVKGWGGTEEAKKAIRKGIRTYAAAKTKPAF